MRKIIGEFIGSTILVAIIVGSASMATNLTEDLAVQLMINAFAVFIGLTVLVAVLASVSGAHFNPAVSLVELIQKRINVSTFFQYIVAQILGAITGAMIGNLMYKRSILESSTQIRSGGNLYIGEIVATACLILVINLLVAQGKQSIIPLAVGGWIGSAFFFTSSTSFANPAVTIGRIFTNSAAGIAPACVPKFIAAQILGALIGFGVFKLLTVKDKISE